MEESESSSNDEKDLQWEDRCQSRSKECCVANYEPMPFNIVPGWQVFRSRIGYTCSLPFLVTLNLSLHLFFPSIPPYVIVVLRFAYSILTRLSFIFSIISWSLSLYTLTFVFNPLYFLPFPLIYFSIVQIRNKNDFNLSRIKEQIRCHNIITSS